MSPQNQAITIKTILDLFERFEDQANARLERFEDATQRQYEKITDNISKMAIAMSEMATSIKISEDRHRGDNRRMQDIEKHQRAQGIELNGLILKVEKNTWVRGSAVKAFLVILTAFAGGLAAAISGYILLKARGLV